MAFRSLLSFFQCRTSLRFSLTFGALVLLTITGRDSNVIGPFKALLARSFSGWFLCTFLIRHQHADFAEQHIMLQKSPLLAPRCPCCCVRSATWCWPCHPCSAPEPAAPSVAEGTSRFRALLPSPSPEPLRCSRCFHSPFPGPSFSDYLHGNNQHFTCAEIEIPKVAK